MTGEPAEREPAEGEPSIEAWPDRLEAAVRETVHFNRVFVFEEADSTQDSAWRLSGVRPGVVVVAGRQRRGRGQRGRSWHDAPGLGLAMSVAIVATRGAAELGAIAGLAACHAARDACPGVDLGIKWPNDVVERLGPGTPGRKIAGVLVEVRTGLAIIGIGMNVLHAREDWPDALAGRAASLAQLGSTWDRLRVAERLLAALDTALCLDAALLGPRWRALDALVGGEHEFWVGGRSVRGTVRAIDPLGEMTIVAPGGAVHRVAAASARVAQPIS